MIGCRKVGAKMLRTIIVSIAFCSAVSAAQAAQVYFNDFEGGASLDGAGGIESVQGYEGADGFSGSFWRNDTIEGTSELKLIGLGSHTTMTIEFDLALIDSWDGGQESFCCDDFQTGPDFFNILVDGNEVLKTSNFDPISDALMNGQFGDGGFNPEFGDSAYQVSLTFAHQIGKADISFFANGAGYQGGIDESWAIDNLRVSTNRENGPNVVPSPATLPLAASALGIGLFGAWRRRRQS